jgi:hypothetical protein
VAAWCESGPGTTHAYHGLFTEEVHSAARSVTKNPVHSDLREVQFPELFAIAARAW